MFDVRRCVLRVFVLLSRSMARVSLCAAICLCRFETVRKKRERVCICSCDRPRSWSLFSFFFFLIRFSQSGGHERTTE